MNRLNMLISQYGVDPRTYRRDMHQRVGKASDVRERTPYGWNAKWAPLVEVHRASNLERLLAK